jgi:hypothetical protein
MLATILFFDRHAFESLIRKANSGKGLRPFDAHRLRVLRAALGEQFLTSSGLQNSADVAGIKTLEELGDLLSEASYEQKEMLSELAHRALSCQKSLSTIATLLYIAVALLASAATAAIYAATH